MAYFTKEQLEAYVGEPITDETYDKAHAYAKAIIERYTGQVFEPITTTEIRKVDDTIALTYYPVRTIKSVRVAPDGEEISEYLYLTYDWGLEILKPMRGIQITVEYDAGWQETPADIQYVALELAKRYIVPTDKPTPTPLSISSGGVSMTYLASDIDHGKPTDDDNLNAILNAYRREKTL
jgi:hypothetical protein